MRVREVKAIVLSMILLAGASAAHAGNYVKGSNGVPVRDGSGACIKVLSSKTGQLTPGCDPVDRVILLPDAEGKVGAVSVSAGGETTLVDSAYGAVGIGAEGKLANLPSSAQEVKGRFRALLNVQPPVALDYVVRFVPGSATELTPESGTVIAAMIADLIKREAPEIRVTGHTDTVGSRSANDRLSKKRAQTVVNLLKAEGVSLELLEAAGRGERQLAVQTADNVDEPQNRRVEITVR